MRIRVSQPAALLCASLLVLSAPALQAQEAVLNVLNWSELISPEVQTTFSQQHGIKLHYDIAQGPFLRVWKKRGSSAIESVLNVSGPIGYNDPNPNAYPKFGAYTWGDGWSVNSPKCTIYHKGVQLFRDEAPGYGEPALGLQSLLATAEAL